MPLKRNFLTRLGLWPISVVLCAVAALGMDLGDFLGGSVWFTWHTWVLEVAGIILLVLTAWRPGLFGLTFIAFQCIASMLPLPWAVGAVSIFVYLLIGYFVFTEYYWLAVVGGLLITVTDLFGYNPKVNFLSVITFDVFALLFAALIGWILRTREESVEEARLKLEETQRDKERAIGLVRENLASTLHDKSVAELSHVVMLCDGLLNSNESENKRKIEMIVSESRQAMRHLREMIGGLKKGESNSGEVISLSETVGNARSLARTCDIELTVMLPDKVEETLDQTSLGILQIFIGEIATNLVKYAEKGTFARIEGDFTDEALQVVSTNQVSQNVVVNQTMSSRQGVGHLAALLSERGGRLNYSSNGKLWMILALIPIVRTSQFEDAKKTR